MASLGPTLTPLSSASLILGQKYDIQLYIHGEECRVTGNIIRSGFALNTIVKIKLLCPFLWGHGLQQVSRWNPDSATHFLEEFKMTSLRDNHLTHQSTGLHNQNFAFKEAFVPLHPQSHNNKQQEPKGLPTLHVMINLKAAKRSSIQFLSTKMQTQYITIFHIWHALGHKEMVHQFNINQNIDKHSPLFFSFCTSHPLSGFSFVKTPTQRPLLQEQECTIVHQLIDIIPLQPKRDKKKKKKTENQLYGLRITPTLGCRLNELSSCNP